MRLLVTGLSGFTGRHLAQAAAAEHWDVVGLNSDLNDAQAVADEVEGLAPDAVVHLAAISFVGHGQASELYQVNTIGTTHLLAALSRLPRSPRAVLVASSANVYGNSEITPIVETQPPAPVNHYAASKLAMEHLARTYHRRLPVMIARPFNYTGPGQASQFLVPKLVEHFVAKRPTIALGNLHVRREINDVRLVCQAYLRLLSSGKPGQTYNVCTGQSYALHDLLEVLQTLTGHAISTEVDQAFVRQDEVHELYGDPTRLTLAIGPLTQYSLKDTLTWMLEAAGQSNDALLDV